jgi:hypothetical protein
MMWNALVGQAHEFACCRRTHAAAAIQIARAQPPPVVLGYLQSASERDAFARSVREIEAVWISNEAPSVFPELAKAAPPPQTPDQFLLAVDGKPVAWTGLHGQSITWFAT